MCKKITIVKLLSVVTLFDRKKIWRLQFVDGIDIVVQAVAVISNETEDNVDVDETVADITDVMMAICRLKLK